MAFGLTHPNVNDEARRPLEAGLGSPTDGEGWFGGLLTGMQPGGGGLRSHPLLTVSF